jgi:hypothetical protein
MRQFIRFATLLFTLSLNGSSPETFAADEPDDTQLRMTPAIACSKINGYEQYEELEGAAITADEKLFVYFKPLNYHVDSKGGKYHVHLAEDARIRRRGEKTVLRRKDDIVRYEIENKQKPANLFMATAVSLKDLPPGDYDLEIILRDRVGKAATASQVVPFRVKAAPKPKDAEEKSKESKDK